MGVVFYQVFILFAFAVIGYVLGKTKKADIRQSKLLSHDRAQAARDSLCYSSSVDAGRRKRCGDACAADLRDALRAQHHRFPEADWRGLPYRSRLGLYFQRAGMCNDSDLY